MFHRRVSNKHIGMNPVARAVARKALEAEIRDRKIQLYMTGRGEPCAELCGGIGLTLSAIAYAAEHDPKHGPSDSLVRIVRGAISACSQMADADSYNPDNTVALDVALDAAQRLNRTVNPELISRAFNAIVAAGA